MSKTHWKKLVNPEYIGVYSLDDGKDKTVTIVNVVRDMVTSTGGKKEECTIAHLKNEKPMILNRTNSKTIASLYGMFIEDWEGKQITLFASTTRLAGETVECLRVRPKVPEKVKSVLSNDRFAAALAGILSGEYSEEKLRKSAALTEEQESQLSSTLEAHYANTVK